MGTRQRRPDLVGYKKVISYLESHVSKDEMEAYNGCMKVNLDPVYKVRKALAVGRNVSFIIVMMAYFDLLTSKEIMCHKEGLFGSVDPKAFQLVMNACYIEGGTPIEGDSSVRYSDYSRWGLIIAVLAVPYVVPPMIWDCFFKDIQEHFKTAEKKISMVNNNFWITTKEAESVAREAAQTLIDDTDKNGFKTCLGSFMIGSIISILLVYALFFKVFIKREKMENTLLFYKFIHSMFRRMSPIVDDWLSLQVICDNYIYLWMKETYGRGRVRCILLNAMLYTLLPCIWQITSLCIVLYLSCITVVKIRALNDYDQFIINLICSRSIFKKQKKSDSSGAITIGIPKYA